MRDKNGCGDWILKGKKSKIKHQQGYALMQNILVPLTGENNLLNPTLTLKAKKKKRKMTTVLEKIENLFCFVF